MKTYLPPGPTCEPPEHRSAPPCLPFPALALVRAHAIPSRRAAAGEFKLS